MRLGDVCKMKKIQLACFLILALHFAGPAQKVPPVARLKPVYVEGKWGYADPRGKIVIKAQFDAARPFIDGLAQVGIVDEELPELDARPNIKWGYIDERGQVLVELRYTVLRPFSENLAAVALLDAEKATSLALGQRNRLNLKWGYLDRNGHEVIPIQFLAAGDFSEGLAPVNSVAGGAVDGQRGEGSLCGTPANYGYIDRTGAFVIKPQFTHASQFQNGRARVSIGRIVYMGRCLCCAPRFVGKHGLIDRSGTFIADKQTDGKAEIEEEVEINR